MEAKAAAKTTPKKDLKVFNGKSFLLIHGTRGLSQEHAEALAERIRKSGGRVIMPDRGKCHHK
jgi:hypothetical protein